MALRREDLWVCAGLMLAGGALFYLWLLLRP